MPQLVMPPPYTVREDVTDVLHGVFVTDPYRWLEDQNSARTRAWIEEQTRYARTYLDNLPGRERIRERIRQFLAVDTYDSLLRVGQRYFFRKRVGQEEQPGIYLRNGPDGADELLIDPAKRNTGPFTAVKPVQASEDGRLLLYEIKQGGERTGNFEIFDVEARSTLPDSLSRGYLRGFAFGPDNSSFFYAYEPLDAKRPFYRAAYRHVIGEDFASDQEIFCAGEDEKIRMGLFSSDQKLVLVVNRFSEKTITDIYLMDLSQGKSVEPLVENFPYGLGVRLSGGRIFGLTEWGGRNKRIVELRRGPNGQYEWIEIVPEADIPIIDWHVLQDRIVVSYLRNQRHQTSIFSFSGEYLGEMPIRRGETVRIVHGSADKDEVLYESESFVEPISVIRYSTKAGASSLWSKRQIRFDSDKFSYLLTNYASKDGTMVPIYIVGRRELLEQGNCPTIMTSYGGYGISMTPQFSVFVAFLLECGCLFALPSIRGGSEFGIEWHNAAKRRKRQTAFDDFLCAASWLLTSGWTASGRLAIFGGSNSGLLVGAALTQRPELFAAVVCMVPMLDMIRYHHFDGAHIWKDEFGTAEDFEDFKAIHEYSPYQRVRDGVAYPAVMFVSGDSDQNCNPLHARKMTARLQTANKSENPIFLDYHSQRGHSPIMPLSFRIDALTDRMAFLCDRLQLEP